MPILNRSKVETATRAGPGGEGAGILRRPSHAAFHTRAHRMSRFILFQRDDCHLCDLALEVLAQARLPEFESVFIDDDATLEARYGIRVPVLRDAQRGLELDWPFDADAVRALAGA